MFQEVTKGTINTLSKTLNLDDEFYLSLYPSMSVSLQKELSEYIPHLECPICICYWTYAVTHWAKNLSYRMLFTGVFLRIIVCCHSNM